MNLPEVKVDVVAFGGGLNLETPHLSIEKGRVIEAENIEPNLNGGYRLISGYERLDGRAAPTSAVWYKLTVDNASGVSIGSITGSNSGATANVVAINGNDLCITNLTGSFNNLDTFSGATVTINEEVEGQGDPKLFASWELAAQDYYRALIQPVSGTGDILGVWHLRGTNYAFRENGGTVKMYKSSVSGWQEVTLYHVLKFDAGVMSAGEILAGDTITGLTSSASGIVKKFVYLSGNYSTDVVGYLVIDVTTGTFQNNENLQKGGVTKAVADGANTAITFATGGKFSFINFNFTGAGDDLKMYGCDGINNAFEFDGTVLTPIYTGMEIDAPHKVQAHKNHLFLAFDGGSLQHSGIGAPFIWSPVFGASELALGNEISGMKSIVGDVMIVSTSRAIHGLYGSSSADWSLKLIASNAGDIADTLDVIGAPYVITSNGITRVDTVQSYGNFVSSTVSRFIRPLLDRWSIDKTIVNVAVSRAKNQYQVFYSDGSGLIMAHDSLYGQGILPQFTTFQLSHLPRCVSSISIDGADEVILMGDNNGYVYQMQRGYSFDGLAFKFALRTPFMHLGSPSVRKAFKRYDIEIDVVRNATLRVSYEFSYGQSHTASSRLNTFDLIGGGGYWGSDNWSEFNWSADEVIQNIQSMTGTGHNISFLFYGDSATNSEFTVNNITIHYIPRKLNRG